MTSFRQEMLGGRGFSLTPPEGLHALPTHGCYSPPSSWWHMLGNKASPPYLSGKRRRNDGICMLVSILWVGRRR